MALLSEFVEPKWQRKRGVRKVHVVAVLSAVAAAGLVLLMFSEFGIVDTSAPSHAERQLVASVDLRLGTPALSKERGQARARADVEAGVLKLQRVGPPPGKAEQARAERMKQRYGVEWVTDERVTPLTTAFAEGYNGVMRAEIERRHGKDVADGLLGFEETRKP